MTLSVMNSGSWTSIGELSVMNSGSWSYVAHGYVMNSGSWTEFFTLALPSISTISLRNDSVCESSNPSYAVHVSWSLDDTRWQVRVYREGVNIGDLPAGTTGYADTGISVEGTYGYSVNYFYSDVEGGQATDSISIPNPCGA
jgi:hypothetical protein